MPIKETLKRPNYLNANWPHDCHYVREGTPASISAKAKPTSLPMSTNKIVISYDNMFVETGQPQQRSVSFHNENGNGNGSPPAPRLWVDTVDSVSGLEKESPKKPNNTKRLAGGSQHQQQEANKFPPTQERPETGMPGGEAKAKVNVISLGMMGGDNSTATATATSHKANFPCLTMPKRLMKLPKATRTRGTQSLYRESSAQTLPYLPAVSNDPDELECMELFKLPTILPGDGTPGLYEVEVLERARKRWAFAKALKDNFRKQLDEARHQVKLPQHEDILEAFEWEHWIEREEYIQECQMLRLEILIRMFDRREQEMRSNSQMRIQQTYAQIEAKRQTALRKNEIEFGRAMRRLEVQHSKQQRTWHKEQLSYGLGDPSSEFYAPQMRYGVDPGRRHYTAARRSFDMRMDDLEKKAVKMQPSDLKCPFAKLRAWSKPKTVPQEVEQNFCTDHNLRKLYESLKTLRETNEKPKTKPLCLKSRHLATARLEPEAEPPTAQSARVTIIDEVASVYEYPTEDYNSDDSENRRLREEYQQQQYMAEVRQEKLAEHQRREQLQSEMRQEEFETLIQSYEGNTIGWLMRFLSEEMCRLKEQRRLHVLTMLAKRERWRREAAEAGLRQKENCLRESYERLYEKCEEANVEMAEQYMRSILEEDLKAYAQQEAEDRVETLAKDLDREMAGWLASCRQVQNPLNYDNLRYALRDIVLPDMEKILYRLERDDCVEYIIDKVLLPNVFQRLEAYDVSFPLASDLVDRLIDNDLHLNSPDCSSDCECSEFCTCSRSRQEAMAILRKLIRHAVPGRRWRTSTERVADENVNDLLDEVFEKSIPKSRLIETNKPMPEVEQKFSYIDLTLPEREVYFSDVSEAESVRSQEYGKISQLGDMPLRPSGDITKSLQYDEQLLLADTDFISEDKFIIHMEEYVAPQPQPEPVIVRPIPSTHDITSVWDFSKTPIYCRTSSDEIPFEEDFSEREVEVEEIRQRMDSWTIEMSSSHGEFEDIAEEDDNEEEENEEEVIETQATDKEMGSQVRFGSNPVVVEQIIEPAPGSSGDDEDDDGGVMPFAFSYDPTVKFTVPIPSSFEMAKTEIQVQGPVGENEIREEEVGEKEENSK